MYPRSYFGTRARYWVRPIALLAAAGCSEDANTGADTETTPRTAAQKVSAICAGLAAYAPEDAPNCEETITTDVCTETELDALEVMIDCAGDDPTSVACAGAVSDSFGDSACADGERDGGDGNCVDASESACSAGFTLVDDACEIDPMADVIEPEPTSSSGSSVPTNVGEDCLNAVNQFQPRLPPANGDNPNVTIFLTDSAASGGQSLATWGVQMREQILWWYDTRNYCHLGSVSEHGPISNWDCGRGSGENIGTDGYSITVWVYHDTPRNDSNGRWYHFRGVRGSHLTLRISGLRANYVGYPSVTISTRDHRGTIQAERCPAGYRWGGSSDCRSFNPGQ